jgi:hypothetical protein
MYRYAAEFAFHVFCHNKKMNPAGGQKMHAVAVLYSIINWRIQMEAVLCWAAGSLAIYHSIQRVGLFHGRRNQQVTSGSSSSSTAAVAASFKVDIIEKKKRVVVVTRVHCLISDNFPDKEKISSFFSNTISCQADGVIICIGAKTLQQLSALQSHIESVIQELSLSHYAIVQPIYPWGYFTNSLNHAIVSAQDRHFSHVLFQVCSSSYYLV